MQLSSGLYKVGNFIISSRKACTRQIHLLKFIYRLLKHSVYVICQDGVEGKVFIAVHILCSAFSVKVTYLLILTYVIINWQCKLDMRVLTFLGLCTKSLFCSDAFMVVLFYMRTWPHSHFWLFPPSLLDPLPTITIHAQDAAFTMCKLCWLFTYF